MAFTRGSILESSINLFMAAETSISEVRATKLWKRWGMAEDQNEFKWGMFVANGAGVGAALGVATKNIAIGVTVGVGGGALLGLLLQKRR